MTRAGDLREALRILNRELAATAAHDPRSFQRANHRCHAGTPHSESTPEAFVGKAHRILLQALSEEEEGPSEPFAQTVLAVAGRELYGLRHEKMCVPKQQSTEARDVVERLIEACRRQAKRLARYLDDAAVGRASASKHDRNADKIHRPECRDLNPAVPFAAD